MKTSGTYSQMNTSGISKIMNEFWLSIETLINLILFRMQKISQTNFILIFFWNFHENLLKWVKIKKNRCISRIKIRKFRTIWKKKSVQSVHSVQFSGYKIKKSVQSIHFGHPVTVQYGNYVQNKAVLACSCYMYTVYCILYTVYCILYTV